MPSISNHPTGKHDPATPNVEQPETYTSMVLSFFASVISSKWERPAAARALGAATKPPRRRAA
jgi:hypothetical protein